MQIEIMFGMIYYLLKHGRTKGKVLANHFEVSTRTIYRYVASLSAFVPIITVLGPYGGVEIDKHFVFDKYFFTLLEKQMLLNALENYSFNLGYKMLIDKIKTL